MNIKPLQNAWSKPVAEIVKGLGGCRDGLSQKEAATRRKKYGPNRLPQQNRATAVELVLKQLKSPLIAILLIAAAISFSLDETVNMWVLLATVLVNVILGFWQENKAESVLEALKQYTRNRARVRRDGTEHDIDAEDLVPGDLIRLTPGFRIPADARILACTDLQIDESILTGESLPVNKNPEPVAENAAVADRLCMLFGGTLVVQGIADAVVTATGTEMEFGRIAELVGKEEREATPLQRAVSLFAKQVSAALLLLCVGLFIIGLLSGREAKEMFFIAVAVAVSAVPEGLPVALTVILASGVERLAKRQGVVRKLLAAETLGSTSLILTDKTGTLTLGHMSLTDVHALDGNHDALLRHAVLATDIVIENPKEKPEQWRILGKAMEEALVRDAAKRGQALPDLLIDFPVKNRQPFNSIQKYGSVRLQDKEILLGAPDVLVRMCDLPEKEKQRMLADIDTNTETGARLLGLALRENGRLHFSGWLAFRDPLRPGVNEAIDKHDLDRTRRQLELLSSVLDKASRVLSDYR